MTVPAAPFRKDHTLTGSIVPLLYDWKVENKTHLLVTLVNTSVTPNAESTLVVDTDYTVNNVGSDTGTITPASAYTAGWKIVITSNVPYEQDTDFTNQNSVKPEEAESMADKLGRQIKQIVEVLSRTVKTTVGGGVQPDDLIDAINDAVTLSSTNAVLTAADVVTTGNNVTSAQAAQAAAESAAAGIKWRPSVRASTTAALPSLTYNNGASGVGATLTATANGALAAQDGVTLTVGQRLLVKDQAAQLQNGVYTLTQVGTGGTPFILTRATDADTWLELVSQAVIIEEGSTLADQAYICTVNQGGTLGTNNVTFGTFSPPIVIASQAEAEAGTENTKAMSALRVRQAITFLFATTAEILSGAATKIVNAANLAPLFYSTKATQTSGTVVPNNTSTVIAFASEEYDDGGWHNNVTNNSRITVDFSGRVHVNGYIDFNTVTNGNCKIEIFKNGALVQSNIFQGPSGIGIKHSISGEFSCTSGDYFELFVLQATGGSITTGTTGYLSVARIK